ncbi:transposase [Azospirillum brasilense]|nr:transposase [Azospirillum brasilense]
MASGIMGSLRRAMQGLLLPQDNPAEHEIPDTPGGELIGPNPTDRGKPGTKYHVVVSTDGIPLAIVPSAANVHDTKLLPDLVRFAQVVCAAIGKLYADAGSDSADNRWLCLRDGIRPYIRKIGEPHGSGLGKVR